jgi:hypothetical protein
MTRCHRLLAIAAFAACAACQPVPPPANGTAPAPAAARAPVPSGAPDAAGKDAAAELAALAPAALAVERPETKAYLDRDFAGACGRGDGRLSFERICEHYAVADTTGSADPSPWPDLVLGIADGRIASAVLTTPEQSLGAGWVCESAPGAGDLRFCFVATTPAGQRTRWAAEWAAYFASAD